MKIPPIWNGPMLTGASDDGQPDGRFCDTQTPTLMGRTPMHSLLNNENAGKSFAYGKRSFANRFPDVLAAHPGSVGVPPLSSAKSDPSLHRLFEKLFLPDTARDNQPMAQSAAGWP